MSKRKSWSDKFISRRQRELLSSATVVPSNGRVIRSHRGTPFCNRRVGVPDYGRQDLLAWGRRVGVRTVMEFNALIKGDANAPGFHHILREFGSWSNYKRHLCLPVLVDAVNVFDLGGYVHLCVGYGCTGYRSDYDIRRHRYGLLSAYKVIKYYGSWYNFRKLIRNYSMELLIEDYVLACLSSGRELTLNDCDDRGIDIRRAMDCFGRNIFNMLVRKKEQLVLGGAVCSGTKFIGSTEYEK